MDEPGGSPARASFPRCAHCGEIIGVYEPTLVEGPGGRRLTSLAADPALADSALVCWHPDCAGAAIDGP